MQPSETSEIPAKKVPDSPLSFVIFSRNESRRIEYVLKALTPYGQVVIMDNHSDDDSPEIARRYGAKVVDHDYHGKWAEEETVATNALRQVETDYVYWGSMDEIPTKKLLLEMVRLANESRYKFIYTRRKNIHYGVEGLNFDSTQLVRLFHKDFVDFRGTSLHGFGKPTCRPDEILYLPNRDDLAVWHCSTYDVGKFEKSHTVYSELEARSRMEQGRKFSGIMLVIRPLYFFWRYYVRGGAWRHGWAGLIMVMQYVFYYFNVYAKIWEIENGVNLVQIEANYDKIKEKLLAQ